MAESLRETLSDLVDAYTQMAHEDLDLDELELDEIGEDLCEAIIESPYRAVIKYGNIYIPDENGLPGESIIVDPAEQEDLDDPSVLNLDEK
jgi:hypothetical protein